MRLARQRTFRSWVPTTHFGRAEALNFYFFISPWVVGFVIFTMGPILASLYFSFCNYKIVSPPQYTGLANYGELFTDKLFWQSLKVTFLYTGLSVPLGLVASLSVAVLLNERIPLLSVFRTLYYLPTVITGVAAALLWRWVLNPEFGILNQLLWSLFRIRGPMWLMSTTWVIPSFVLMSVWGLGGPMIIYLAGLQSVPTSLYEAAEIDGANAWQRFWNITLPMISPVIQFTLITGIIGSFQVFTQVYVVTDGRGGPNYGSLVYVLYLFQNAFRNWRMRYASAQAWILFLIILTLTVLALRAARERVYYEQPGG